MSTEWLAWCRLCAKEGAESNIEIFPKDEFTAVQSGWGTDGHTTNLELAVTIEQHFSVHITAEEMLPKMICPDCFNYLTTLVNYSERVARVQDMFASLQQTTEANESLDLSKVRWKFSLEDEQQEQTFLEVQFDEDQLKVDSTNEQVNTSSLTKIEQFETESNSSYLAPDYVKSENSEEEAVEQIEIDEAEKDPFLDSDDFEPSQQTDRNKSSSNGHEDESPPKKIRRLTKKRPRVASPPEDEADNKAKLKSLRCPYCPNEYMRIKNLHNHLKRTHKISKPKVLKSCDQCPRKFATEFQLRNHFKSHLPAELKKNIPCPQCDNKFSSNELLRCHIKFVHMDERPFICEECGRAVRTNAALRTHMLTHTDAAPFQCEICQRGFKDARRLKKHSEIHDPKKHICGECGAELNSRVTLYRHLLVHTDKLEHKCDYCGKAFRTAKSLKSHLILHTGLKPYSCDFCERTFANGPNCRTHKKKAHPEELAALEAAGGKTYTSNIPKLAVLKAVTKAADNLAPVATKNSGNFLHLKSSQKEAASSKSANVTASTKPLKGALAALQSRVPETILRGSPNEFAKLPPINQICSRLYKNESPS